MSHKLYLAITFLIISGCKKTTDSQTQFYVAWVGVGTGGHEYLTQYGMEISNFWLKNDGISTQFFKLETNVPNGNRAQNNDPSLTGFSFARGVIRGNYLMDRPMEGYKMGLPGGEPHIPAAVIPGQSPEFYKQVVKDWVSSPANQHLHFLRSVTPGKPTPSAYESCKTSQNVTISLAKKALQSWKPNDVHQMNAAHYYLGAATHTLQDGFSRAHVEREANYSTQLPERNRLDVNKFRVLGDVCVYGVKENIVEGREKVCRHGSVSMSTDEKHHSILNDYIWQIGLEDQDSNVVKRLFNKGSQRVKCLNRQGHKKTYCMTTEAKFAVRTTASFLYKVVSFAQTGSKNEIQLGRIIQDIFDKAYPVNYGDGTDVPSEGPQTGYGFLNCESLKKGSLSAYSSSTKQYPRSDEK